jgi:hypothetical protein
VTPTNPTCVWVAYDPDGPTDHYSAATYEVKGLQQFVARFAESGRAVKRVTPDEAKAGLRRYFDDAKKKEAGK